MLPIPLFISCLWRSEPPARDHLQTLRVPAALDGNSRPTAGWGLHPQHCNCASPPLQACIPSIAIVYPRHCNCAPPALQLCIPCNGTGCIPSIAGMHPQNCNCTAPALQLCIPSTACMHPHCCNCATLQACFFNHVQTKKYRGESNVLALKSCWHCDGGAGVEVFLAN